MLGLITFLCGVGLLFVTFKLAFSLFGLPPAEAVGLHANQTLDANSAGTALLHIGFRIGMLLVMCIVGSVLAGRGIKLYVAATHVPPPESPDEPKQSG